MISRWLYSRVVRDPHKTSCWSVSLCPPSFTNAKIQEDHILILLINRRIRVKLKFLLSQPRLSLIYMHTHTHTGMQTQSYSVLHVSCSPAAGVWRQGAPLCWTPPLRRRLWSPLLGKHWLRRASWQPASQRLRPHRPKTQISLIRMHLLWHHDLTLSISPFFLSFFPPNTFGLSFPLSNIILNPSLSSLFIQMSLRRQLYPYSNLGKISTSLGLYSI